MPAVTITTNATAAEAALKKLEAYGGTPHRRKVREFLDSLDGYGNLLCMSTEAGCDGIRVTLGPSERLLAFLSTVEAET